MLKKSTVFVWLVMFIALSGSLSATETGEIQGRVVDENGEVLPGVQIVAKSRNLQGIRTVISSAKGDFLLPLLPVGQYTLTFEL